MTTRLIDDHTSEGVRTILIETTVGPCTDTSNPANRVHPCILDPDEGMPRCVRCGDFIPAPVGLVI